MRALRKYQAPMLRGSSCTHTTGVPSAIAGERLRERAAQRVVLLEAHDGDVVALAPAPLGRQVVVHLAAAQEDALDLRSRRPTSSAMTRWNEPSAISSSVLTASGCRSSDFGVKMTSGLRHGRFTCRRSTWKSCAGVVRLQTWMLSSAAELQEPLDARARVLRPLSLEAVGQEQHEAGEARPLVLRRDDELVDDDLRGVREVAELRLPHDELVGPVERVAVLEAEHAGLAERRVVDLEAADAARRCVTEMRERRVGLAGLRVEENRVPVREGPAARVLSADADAVPLEEDRREREVLGGPPVERLAGRARARGAARGA